MPRRITHRYVDPLDAVWLQAAHAMGLRVERDPEVFAATDGRGTLRLGTPETLDADDCLAQMVFHEICHWIVEGEAALGLPDWGLDNVTDRDLWREEATLRLQAALLQPHGLRQVLAPTTDHRARYDTLPADPAEGAAEPVARRLAEALRRAEQPPWAPHLQIALRATAGIARLLRELGAHRAGEGLPSLWERYEPPAG